MRVIKFRMLNSRTGKFNCDESMVMQCLNQQVTGFYDHVGKHGDVFEQFTGLLDKNGVDIYEGDIVRWSVNDVAPVGFVFFGSGCFDMSSSQDASTARLICWDHHRGESEVLGNIHQNPELLES